MKFHVHACVIELSDRALSSIFKRILGLFRLYQRTGVMAELQYLSTLLIQVFVCASLLLLSEPADGYLCPLPGPGKLQVICLQSCFLLTHRSITPITR